MSDKLEWNDKEDPDNQLYNAMIWALSIGIVIVIVTLFLTRPEPESFSELYFNNHTTLPEYVNLNTNYPYSFTIHNLENKNVTYTYTTSIEYFALDFSCEKPDIYLEKTQDDSRITDTKDPALYIKEEYAIRFNYELKAGNRIAFKLVDVNNTPKYIILIDHLNNKMYYIGNNTIVMNISKGTKSHSLNIKVTNNTVIRLDNEVFTINQAYTSGFIQLETVNTYAEFSNFIITRNNVQQTVYVRLADAVYQEYIIAPVNNTLTPNQSINLTNYNVKASFRTYGLTLQLRNTTYVTYDDNRLTLNNSNYIEKYQVNPKTVNDLSADVNNKSINIYFNGEFITSVDNNNTILTPIITYDNVTVNNFYIKSNDEPVTINYKLSQATQSVAGLLTRDTLSYFTDNPSVDNITQNMTDEELTSFQEYYDRTKITYEDYRITTVYTDRTKDNILSIALVGLSNNIYKVTIDNKNNTANIMNTTVNITPQITNTLIIDVKNNTLSVILNNKNIFNSKINHSSGIVVYDYEKVTISNAQLEDRTTGSTIIFQKQANINCDPILLNKYIYKGTTTIADKDLKSIKDTVTFNQTFDIAKVQVSLDNNQEIHYWVKLI